MCIRTSRSSQSGVQHISSEGVRHIALTLRNEGGAIPARSTRSNRLPRCSAGTCKPFLARTRYRHAVRDLCGYPSIAATFLGLPKYSNRKRFGARGQIGLFLCKMCTWRGRRQKGANPRIDMFAYEPRRQIRNHIHPGAGSFAILS
jgi:hypothetical protein